ncbi:hypothetical protein Peur_046820 [Populus x canadensis]
MLIWRRRRQARRLLPATCRAGDCSNIFREGSNKHRHLVVNGPALVSLMSWTDKLQVLANYECVRN